MLQKGAPVFMHLKLCQQNHAQTQKEILVTVFDLTQFHQYIYGEKVLVETDRKLLQVINTPPPPKKNPPKTKKQPTSCTVLLQGFKDRHSLQKYQQEEIHRAG